MTTLKQNIIEKHLKTHTEQSDEDRSAVTLLQSFLRSDGKINSNFAHGDKWPNIDGTFEFVPEPLLSRCPKQNFSVQIKGTNNYSEKDGIVKYCLKSLGFPAYIYAKVTFDPGILFIVLNPNSRGRERVFWKYMSTDFVNSIHFEQDSTTLYFTEEEEIKNTDESINKFCQKLLDIVEHHSFINQLDDISYSKHDIENIIKSCDEEICENFDRWDKYNDTRDNISKRMLCRLQDLCKSTLLLNLLLKRDEKVNIKLAWEYSILNSKTKYLGSFYRALKYIGNRIPNDGQSERLMLKYYNFLWQIRKFLYEQYGMKVLHNLEKFPLNIDSLDFQYYKLVAKSFDSSMPKVIKLSTSRYYIKKKTVFFINGERYYEITLQLADIYATKYNRITAYTKEDISTNYSIQIGYIEKFVNMWNVNFKIKIITNWEVSINPKSLNKLGKILRTPIKLSSKHGEYIALMNFLTETGLNLLELIDLQEDNYNEVINKIYNNVNTDSFKNILNILRTNFSNNTNKIGHNTIRYLLLHLREDLFDNIIPNLYNAKVLKDGPYISTKCLPFEKNPYIFNLVGTKTSDNDIVKMIDVATEDRLNIARPYITVKNEINKTGEIYFARNTIVNDDEISAYNIALDKWEKEAGYIINTESDNICIDAYERSTLFILQKLIAHSQGGIKGQEAFNKKYVKDNLPQFTDLLKEKAIREIFVNSRLLLVYGAAGTGKTTLLNYISNMMVDHKKLFLTKTHTALQNLKRRIENPGQDADFISFDSFTKRIQLQDYDIIFVDECSTIDNRKMEQFFQKINENTLLVLAGDIHQIESIDFGNWFFYAKEIINTVGANVELLSTWRTDDENLKCLWNEVRCHNELITEKLVIDGDFSEIIGQNILNNYEKDEVILCLNYDGKFGLNNINNYFQNANQNNAIYWQEWSYKIGDPILFNDSKRYSILYNNLKGRIVDIDKSEKEITFTIDVEMILTEKLCAKEDIEFVETIDDNTTRIRIKVCKYDGNNTEEDSEYMHMCSIIPFQLAYAVSIHKAQGLEYDSVKIIIPNSNSEKITHGIFYTAITRAKKKLKIYWSAETMQQIINSFNVDNLTHRSLDIIKQKLAISIS